MASKRTLTPKFRAHLTRLHQKVRKPDAGLRDFERNYKRNARIKNRDYMLTSEDFRLLVSGDCHYCGAPPVSRMQEKNLVTVNGIDRLDSDKGYVMENCVPCCTACNLSKLDRTPEQFIAHCTAVATKNMLDNLSKL